MSEQMSFVYVQATGHVLAVATLAAAPKTPPVAADLASPTLVIRSFDKSGARLDLTPDLLAVFTGDPKDAALVNPRGYSWDAAAKQVQSLTYGSLVVTATTPSTGGINVTLPNPSAGPTNVIVAYAGADPSKSETATGQVASGATQTNVATGVIASGSYYMVLAAGYPMLVQQAP